MSDTSDKNYPTTFLSWFTLGMRLARNQEHARPHAYSDPERYAAIGDEIEAALGAAWTADKEAGRT